MIGPASSKVVPASAIAWSALLAGLQLSGVATRGVVSSQGSRKPLSAADRLRWNARLVSTAHAVVLVIGAPFTPCTKLLACPVDPLQATSPFNAAADISHAHSSFYTY